MNKTLLVQFRFLPMVSVLTAIALVCVSSLISSSAQGQNLSYGASSDETLPAVVEGSFSDYSTADMHGPILAPTIEISGDHFVSSVPTRSWFADTELVAFRASYGSIDFKDGDGNDKYNGTLRLNLGWESESGFGIRGRLWGFEMEGNGPVASTNPFGGGFSTMRGFDFRGATPSLVGGGLVTISNRNITLGAGSLDLDFYKRFDAGSTNLVVGTGLRFAALNFDLAGVSEDTVATGGISFFSELRHVFRQTEVSEWAVVGGARVAWLSGEWEHQTPDFTRTYDANMITSEASLGLEWKRDLGWGALTLRSQYELQRWDSDVTSDVAFNGAALRVGLSW